MVYMGYSENIAFPQVFCRGFLGISGDCTEFCGMGFQPMRKHGQDGRATPRDTKIRTVPISGKMRTTGQKTFPISNLRLAAPAFNRRTKFF
jgi:hypothetical protein